MRLICTIGGSCYKYHFCCDKTRLLTLATKIFLSQQNFCQNVLLTLSWQTRVCHTQKNLLSWRKYACHDKTLVAANMCLLWQSKQKVLTNVLSQQKYFWYKYTSGSSHQWEAWFPPPPPPSPPPNPSSWPSHIGSAVPLDSACSSLRSGHISTTVFTKHDLSTCKQDPLHVCKFAANLVCWFLIVFLMYIDQSCVCVFLMDFFLLLFCTFLYVCKKKIIYM